MTNEEMQRMLEFIIKQQESFAENMTKAEARMTSLETAFVGLFSIVGETVKAQKELAESQKELAALQKELTETQKQTDGRLSALINVVERYIGEGRNGNARS
jgi:c-di-GMP-related signal transduction protein